MDPEPTRRTDRPTIDDAALAALVRDATDDWRMPPQRLDDVTWRERVGRRRGSAGGGVRWTRRLAGAATLAVVATIALSFLAVSLTSPRRDRGVVGASPGASGSDAPVATGGTPAPSVSSRPLATPLPQLTRNGELPSVTSVMVSARGRYRLADLATGTLGPETIGLYSGPSAVMARPDGGWVCICSDWTNRTVDSDSIKLTLDGLDQAGASTVVRPYRTITGTADPTEDAALQAQLADARMSSSPDGRFGFIGWSRRDGADGWTVGVDVIDLASLDVVTTGEVKFVDPMVVDGRAHIRTAPAVAVSPTGSTLLLSSFWYADEPNASNPPSGTDHWLATFDERAIGDIAAAGGTSSDVCMELDAGLITDTAADGPVYYAACWTPAGTAMVKRIRADGWLVDATDIPPPAGGFDGGTMVTRSRDSVFVWSPFRQVLARFDLGTAAVAMGSARTAAVPDGPGDTLATLGRRLGQWIAPSVLAKVFLEPGIVVSPDGSRVYALGIDSPDESLGGSAGVFAFDATTLEPVGHWPPLADLMSIAVSADGRYVYAAAMAGFDADGNEAPYGSSITVYDVADGSVRLMAGQLGTAELLFPAGIVR